MKKPVVTSIELSNSPFSKLNNQKIVTYSVYFDEFTVTGAADCPSGSCDEVDIMNHVQGNIDRYSSNEKQSLPNLHNAVTFLEIENRNLKDECDRLRSNNTDLIIHNTSMADRCNHLYLIESKWWYKLFYSAWK